MAKTTITFNSGDKDYTDVINNVFKNYIGKDVTIKIIVFGDNSEHTISITGSVES